MGGTGCAEEWETQIDMLMGDRYTKENNQSHTLLALWNISIGTWMMAGKSLVEKKNY